jgi:hypothetical protein
LVSIPVAPDDRHHQPTYSVHIAYHKLRILCLHHQLVRSVLVRNELLIQFRVDSSVEYIYPVTNGLHSCIVFNYRHPFRTHKAIGLHPTTANRNVSLVNYALAHGQCPTITCDIFQRGFSRSEVID